MKQNEKLRILSEVDEKYIEEANETIHFGTGKKPLLKVLSLAACAVLAIGILAVPFINRTNDREDFSDPQIDDREMSWVWNKENGTFDYVAYSALASLDEEMSVKHENDSGKLSSAIRTYRNPLLIGEEYNQYLYYHNKIDLKHIDRVIGKTKLKLGLDENGDEIICDADVYNLYGIDPHYAVAVKADVADPNIQNSNLLGYLLCYRRNVCFETFADLVCAYGLKEQMYLGFAVETYSLMTGTGETQTTVYSSEEQDIFLKNLLSVDGTSSALLDDSGISVGVDCGFFVTKGNFAIQIFEKGYLMTNIGGTLHTFFIGEDTAKALIAEAQAIPDRYSAITVYENIKTENDGGITSPYDPAFTSGPYIPETAETTGVLPDGTDFAEDTRYPIATIPE